ncbi:hypothetical protein Q2T40_10700 [Winogradskyella maritima]|uniref:Secreted protein n=1 Tax=Winogradskyella maritima TaxID=1517766 RepID=A0ABV8AJ53_9FLAO|nr:hypothetical protein [Winogradskyella maritima]
MKIVQYLFIAICFSFSLASFGQGPDKEKKSIRIPAIEFPKEKDSTPVKTKVAPKNKPEDKKDSLNASGKKESIKKWVIKDSEKPFNMTETDGLRSAGEIFEQRWNKEANKIGIRRTMSDQFLGEHRIDSKFVNIVCRDHEYPDGDRVRILVNEKIIYPNVLLSGQYRRLQIDLADGINKIDILALNQGDSGPNTAEFIVYDDKGNVVSNKEWNLLTGVKATIVFVNEKVSIVPKTAQN